MAKKRKPVPVPEPEPEPEPSSSEEEEIEEEEEEEEEEIEEEEEEEVEEVESEEEEEDDEEKKEPDDGKIDPLDRDAIRKLLEPFGKDQLVDLLAEAATRTPAIYSRIFASSRSDPAHRNVFVHGLGWDTTTDALAAAFSPFGTIEECKVVSDRATGHCKGYGFVLFRSAAAARGALKEPQKRIGGRLTSCQLASFGPPGAQGPVVEPTGRKLYVSNVPTHASPDRLRAFFAQFGEIEEGPLGGDRVTGNLRGFAIFVYKTMEACARALQEPKKVFDGCELQCQRALEGLKPKNTAVPVSAPVIAPQANDLAMVYASQSLMGLNQAMNPAAAVGLLGQNAGIGLLNQGVAAGLAGVSPFGRSTGPTPRPYGVGLGIGGGVSGINTISPSVIGNYGSQAALQGLGAYQNNQLSSTAAVRSQAGIGSIGTSLPPYLGR